MQKKLIALAVAGIMAAPMAANAATAEVYGKVRLSVGIISDDNPGATAEDSKISVSSHSSRLGFKGSEDLGGGLTGVWQLETQVDMDDNSNGDAFESMRNTFVGLAGDFGTVALGRHDTPYKMATSDIMGDSYGDYNAVISSTHDYRSDNVIAYLSPDFNGLSFAVAYVPDVEDATFNNGSDNLPDNTKDDDNDALSMNVKYGMGPWAVSLAVQSVSNASGANTSDAEATKLGFTFDFGATDLTVIYENEENGAAQDQDNFYVGVAQALGNNTLKAAIGQKGESTSGASDGGDFVSVGFFNKRTDNVELYAILSQMDNDKNGTNGIGDLSSGFNDKTTRAIAVGINMNFSSM